MRRKLIILLTAAIICISIPTTFLLKNSIEVRKKREATNNALASNSIYKIAKIKVKAPVEESHSNSYPTTLSKQLMPLTLIKPKYSQKYYGSNKEVQEYVAYLLKNPASTTVPENYMSMFYDTTPGTPLFIKDERDPSIDVVQDRYIVPLIKDNVIVGQCSVDIWGDELALGGIGLWEDRSGSIFRSSLNELFDKVSEKAGVELKSYQYVWKPDYKNRTNLTYLDPQIRITAIDGRVFYYSSKGLALSKAEADENSLIKYQLPGGLWSQ